VISQKRENCKLASTRVWYSLFGITFSRLIGLFNLETHETSIKRISEKRDAAQLLLKLHHLYICITILPPETPLTPASTPPEM